jgi:histidinol phosphatase-like enzyme
LNICKQQIKIIYLYLQIGKRVDWFKIKRIVFIGKARNDCKIEKAYDYEFGGELNIEIWKEAKVKQRQFSQRFYFWNKTVWVYKVLIISPWKPGVLNTEKKRIKWLEMFWRFF